MLKSQVKLLIENAQKQQEILEKKKEKKLEVESTANSMMVVQNHIQQTLQALSQDEKTTILVLVEEHRKIALQIKTMDGDVAQEQKAYDALEQQMADLCDKRQEALEMFEQVGTGKDSEAKLAREWSSKRRQQTGQGGGGGASSTVSFVDLVMGKQGLEVKLNEQALPIGGKGKFEALVRFLEGHSQKHPGEAREFLSFMRLFGIFCRSANISADTCMAALLNLNETTQKKWHVTTSSSLSGTLRNWERLLTSGLKVGTIAAFYNTTRTTSQTLESAWAEVTPEVELLLLSKEATWDQIRVFLMGARYLNGWHQMNQQLYSKLEARERSCGTVEELILVLKDELASQLFQEVTEKKVMVILVPPAPPLEGTTQKIFQQKPYTCRGCGATGHIQAYCPNLPAEKRKEWQLMYDRSNKGKSSKYLCLVSKNQQLIKDVWSVLGRVNQKEVIIGLDTWAQTNIVRKSVLSTEVLELHPGCLSGFAGAETFTDRQAEITVQVGVGNGEHGTSFRVKCVVVEDSQLPCDVLLGASELGKLGVVNLQHAIFNGTDVLTVGQEERQVEQATRVVLTIQDLQQSVGSMSDTEVYPSFGSLIPDNRAQDEVELIGKGEFALQEGWSHEEELQLHQDIDKMVDEAEFSAVGKAKLREILMEHKDVFAYVLTKPGQVGAPVKLTLNGQAIKQQRKWESNAPEKKKWMQEKVDAYETHGLCRKLREDERPRHISNLVGIDARGKQRITQNFTDLNEGTVQFEHPLRKAEAVRTYQGKAQFFSTLDEIDCYFQHPLHEDSKVLTAFYAPDKDAVMVWNCMPQGIKQAPAVLHQHKDLQYMEFSNNEVNYLFDDTLLMSEEEAEHISLIGRFLSCVRRAGEKLKPPKCRLGKKQVKFNGFLISKGQWEVDPIAVQAIRDFPTPKTKKQLKQFLGMTNTYRAFIGKYTELCVPLLQYVTDSAKWDENTWKHIKNPCVQLTEQLAKEVLLQVPDWNQPFHFWIDAGPNSGIAGVVGQVRQDGVVVPIHFFSRRATPAESKLWPTEMELAGAKWVLIEKGRRYTHGAVFWHTDAEALKGLNIAREKIHNTTRKRLMNDLAELAAISDLKIVWHPRSEMQHVDTLSRAHTEVIQQSIITSTMEKSEETVSTEINVKLCHATFLDAATPANLAKEQEMDPVCMHIRMYLEGKGQQVITEHFDSLPNQAKQLLTSYRDKDGKFQKFKVDAANKLLYHLEQRDGKEQEALVVPYVLKERIVHAYHDSFLAGHRGRAVMREALAGRFWWIGRTKDIKTYIDACDKCTKAKKGRQEYAGLEPIQKLRAFEKVNMDFIGPLTTSAQDFKYLLVMVCSVSGEVRLAATKTKASVEVAKAFLDKLILRGDIPQILQTDWALEFTSGMMASLNTLLGVKGIAGSPYHPQANGAVERKNATIATNLRIFCDSGATNWPDLLPFVEYSMNTAVNPAIGMSPYYFNRGYDTLDILYNAYAKPPNKDAATFQEWKINLENAREIAGQHLTHYQHKMKQQFDKDKIAHTFKSKDEVYVFFPRKKKLDCFFHGPYIIRELSSSKRTAIVGHKSNMNDELVVNIDRLILAKSLSKEFKEDPEMVKWRKLLKQAAGKQSSKHDQQQIPVDLPHREVQHLEEDEYVVEKIVDHRDVKRKVGKKKKKVEIREYLVRFAGFNPTYDEWIEEEELLQTAAKTVTDYLELKKIT